MSESILTVTTLTRDIKRLLSESFGAVWIEGEISGFKLHSSGHAYFTLKDAGAQLSCVMWRGTVTRNTVPLRDGAKIHAFGNIEVYEPQGKYQLIVAAARPAGLGELQIKFEQLKARLQSEGLFALERKRALPTYPERIGIVTSPTGAVLQDMRTVAARRWPAAQLVLAPVKVQGDGAAQEIAAAIDRFNRASDVDLIIVGRGGGSLEDLWAFNEEVVARAMFASSLPVVSAVGHEVDFTIADLVADLRAPTPSAAMEIILPDREQVAELVEQLQNRLRRSLVEQLKARRDAVNSITQHWAFRQPLHLVMMAAQRVDDLQSRLHGATAGLCNDQRTQLARLQELMTAYHPHAVLNRGYTITRNARGDIIRNVGAVQQRERLTITFAQGAADVAVESLSP